MEQYESGMQAICDLQQIVSSTEGVMGSRFMGEALEGALSAWSNLRSPAMQPANIEATYQKIHPEVAGETAVYLACSDDGVRFL